MTDTFIDRGMFSDDVCGLMRRMSALEVGRFETDVNDEIANGDLTFPAMTVSDSGFYYIFIRSNVASGTLEGNIYKLNSSFEVVASTESQSDSEAGIIRTYDNETGFTFDSPSVAIDETETDLYFAFHRIETGVGGTIQIARIDATTLENAEETTYTPASGESIGNRMSMIRWDRRQDKLWFFVYPSGTGEIKWFGYTDSLAGGPTTETYSIPSGDVLGGNDFPDVDASWCFGKTTAAVYFTLFDPASGEGFHIREWSSRDPSDAVRSYAPSGTDSILLGSALSNNDDFVYEAKETANNTVSIYSASGGSSTLIASYETDDPVVSRTTFLSGDSLFSLSFGTMRPESASLTYNPTNNIIAAMDPGGAGAWEPLRFVSKLGLSNWFKVNIDLTHTNLEKDGGVYLPADDELEESVVSVEIITQMRDAIELLAPFYGYTWDTGSPSTDLYTQAVNLEVYGFPSGYGSGSGEQIQTWQVDDVSDLTPTGLEIGEIEDCIIWIEDNS